MKHSPPARGFTLIELMIAVAIVGVLALVGAIGLRRYLAAAKTAEARNSLGQIGKGALMSYEKETMSSDLMSEGATAKAHHRLCGAASTPVPANVADISGKKYQSNTAAGQDYAADVAAAHVGFACLRFHLDQPQYYQYSYWSDSHSFYAGSRVTATAIGDLNGDGTYSTFQLYGVTHSGFLEMTPTIVEDHPEE